MQSEPQFIPEGLDVIVPVPVPDLLTVNVADALVVKAQIWSVARALPARSLPPAVIVAVYIVEKARLAFGVSVAVVPE